MDSAQRPSSGGSNEPPTATESPKANGEDEDRKVVSS